jgi:uncharacterized protein (DUF2267 family)
MTNIPILNKNVQKVHEWLNDIQDYAGWERDEDAAALAILRATLHELRDHIPLNDLAHFSAQLPLIIRGLLFESWDPSSTLISERHLDDFLERISDSLPEIYRYIDVENAVKAVISTLQAKLGIGGMEKIQKNLPHSIREIFVRELI